MLEDFHQWSNAEPYIGSLRPSYVSGIDGLRLGAYNLYEQIYWTIPDVFEITQRGTEDNPIYIPSAKGIVETLHRYLASGYRVIEDPSVGSDTEKRDAAILLQSLFRRERYYSGFSSAKRYGIMQGDWLFHITADNTKPEGSRISIISMDPASYFPIENPDNVDETIGAHLASVVTEDGETYIHRVTYRKTTMRGGPSPMTVEEALYDPDSSGLPGIEEGNPFRVIRPPTLLPNPIDQIPIYHIQNFDQPGSEWGSSECRGIERLMAAINQGVTDEELALALEGLGVYHCDGGAPVNEDGEEVPWDIGPARVVEHAKGTVFGRVQGVTTIAPMQEHIKYLHNQLDESKGISAIAKGKVDVAVAESGIALMLELGPLLAAVVEKEQVITDVKLNMLWDLRRWFQAFEPNTGGLENIVWVPMYGDKLPPNRKQKFDEIMSLLGVTPPVVTRAWGREELRKIGYEFPPEAEFAQAILLESQQTAQIETDVIGARMDQAMNGITGGNGQVTGDPAAVG